MVFQSYALFPHMNVLDNVAYGLRSERRPADEVTTRAREALATVGLGRYESRLPVELSGGQQQRVALARAIVLEPSVLLFDEPLSNLDARLRREMREEIRALQQRLGVTVVYVTHDQAEALAVSDRIVIMDQGRIAGEGAPRDLYERPRSEFVARFMGEANIVSATLVRDAQGNAWIEAGSVRWPADARDVPPGPVRCALRPESLALTGRNEGLAGTVATAAYVGASMEYRIETALGRLFVASPSVDRPASPGDAVGLRLTGAAIVLDA
jgi:iron(III) transport system ATP-binding protein